MRQTNVHAELAGRKSAELRQAFVQWAGMQQVVALVDFLSDPTMLFFARFVTAKQRQAEARWGALS